MAAATVNYGPREYMFEPILVMETELSALTADQAEDLSHGGPAGKKCSYVTFEIVTPPTALCSVTPMHDKDNDSTTNDTARVRFVAGAGGDLTGMVARVRFHFKHFKVGGNVAVDDV